MSSAINNTPAVDSQLGVSRDAANRNDAFESEQLLSISESLASIKNKEELFGVILQKMKPRFRFDQAVVAIFDNTRQGLDVFSVDVPSLGETGHLVLEQQLINFNYPYDDFFRTILLPDQPVVFRCQEEFEKNNSYIYLDFMSRYGIVESMSIPLLNAGQMIGGLFIHSFSAGRFQKDLFDLFRKAANQIAVAVANILSNEEVASRQREQSTLLTISEAVATVRDKETLLKLMFDSLKPLFGFYDAGLFIIDRDRQYVEDWTVTMPGTSPSLANDEANKAQAGRFSYPGSGIDWYVQRLKELGTADIVSYDEDLFNRFPEHPQWNAIKSAGYQESMGTLLRSEGQEIGVLFCNSLKSKYFSPAQFSLFQGVADLFAIAVLNILANEEIAKREREKSLLLSIGQSIASIRDKNELLEVITGRIIPAIGAIDLAPLFVVSRDRKSYITWFVKHDKEGPSALVKESKDWVVAIEKDPLAQEIIYQTPAAHFKDLSYFQQKYPGHPGVVISEQFGVRQALIIPFRVGGETIGCINFHSDRDGAFTEDMLGFYQGIGDQLGVAVSNILANEEVLLLNERLKQENSYLLEEVESKYNMGEFIGQGEAIREVCRNIGLVARTASSVLIQGETGTGKELVARAIHNHSARKDKPLIKVNCAALPPQLIESELFGHERGAFSGAVERRIGKFEIADGSTLFLDEIGELPVELQPKLLRAIQEKEIERLGSNKVIKVDVRLISATNRDLVAEVNAGKFRSDLYYRINVFPITLPPLRQRKEDIPLLTAHFIQKAAKKTGKSILGLSGPAGMQLAAYDWPGNVRELEHLIERAVILSPSKVIQDVYLPAVQQQAGKEKLADYVLRSLDDLERDYILHVLRQCRQRIYGAGGAAEVLNIPASSLQSKMKKLGILRKHIVE